MQEENKKILVLDFKIFLQYIKYMAKRGRPKKSQDCLKKRVVQIRLLDVEKESFTTAADLAGLSLSSWIRERLREAARKELQKAGKKISFLS